MKCVALLTGHLLFKFLFSKNNEYTIYDGTFVFRYVKIKPMTDFIG